MAIDLAFSRRAIRNFTNRIGGYVLCDLDQVPIYASKSVEGIRSPSTPRMRKSNLNTSRVSLDRSAIMRAVKSRDTGPERRVRAMLREIAPGYRLHRADLPGKPDIVYAGRKLAIFVHGCFWHGHNCRRGARVPKANADYWRAKIARNRTRDQRTLAAIDAMGWRALTVYECELKDAAALRTRLAEALIRQRQALSMSAECAL